MSAAVSGGKVRVFVSDTVLCEYVRAHAKSRPRAQFTRTAREALITRENAHGRALINGSANEVSMYTSRTGSARQALSIFVLQPSAE